MTGRARVRTCALMLRLLLPLLLCSACQTIHTTERFELKPHVAPSDVIAAAEEAATRLGAEVHQGRGDHFELHTVRGLDGKLHDWVKVASPRPGLLEVTTDGYVGLGTVSAALAAGTLQVLSGEPAVTSRVEPRSLPMTMALDVLFPFAGGLYVDSGDPYGRPWMMRFMALGLDLAAGMLLAVTALGPPGPNPWILPALAITELVLNRFMSISFDIHQLKRRNAAAASGFDLATLPQPSSTSVNPLPPG